MKPRPDLRAVELAEQGVQTLPGIGAFSSSERISAMERAAKLDGMVADHRRRVRELERWRQRDEERKREWLANLPRERGGVVLEEPRQPTHGLDNPWPYTVGTSVAYSPMGTVGRWVQ